MEVDFYYYKMGVPSTLNGLSSHCKNTNLHKGKIEAFGKGNKQRQSAIECFRRNGRGGDIIPGKDGHVHEQWEGNINHTEPVSEIPHSNNK